MKRNHKNQFEVIELKSTVIQMMNSLKYISVWASGMRDEEKQADLKRSDTIKFIKTQVMRILKYKERQKKMEYLKILWLKTS